MLCEFPQGLSLSCRFSGGKWLNQISQKTKAFSLAFLSKPRILKRVGCVCVCVCVCVRVWGGGVLSGQCQPDELKKKKNPTSKQISTIFNNLGTESLFFLILRTHSHSLTHTTTHAHTHTRTRTHAHTRASNTQVTAIV